MHGWAVSAISVSVKVERLQPRRQTEVKPWSDFGDMQGHQAQRRLQIASYISGTLGSLLTGLLSSFLVGTALCSLFFLVSPLNTFWSILPYKPSYSFRQTEAG